MKDKNQIEISVIVTVYNIENYIRECLDSILNQEDVNLECICVDDVSTDRSLEIVKEYAQRDQRITIIQNQKNMGLSSSRNVGFRHASGEYLYNIDGDDYLKPGALKRMYSCAKENNLDLLGFSATAFFDDETMRGFGRVDEYVRKGTYEDIVTGPELFAKLINNNDRASSNMVLYFYRRDYFEKNNLYGIEYLRYADDSMFAMYMAAQRAMCIPDQLYMRRYRKGSVCTSPMKMYYLESLIVLFLQELQIWQNCNLDHELNRTIEKYFITRHRQIKSLSYRLKSDEAGTPLLDQNLMAKYVYKYFIAGESLYQEYPKEEDIIELKNTETIILYGAGYIADEIASILEQNQIHDYMVAVTNKDTKDKKFRGKKIYNICELQAEKEHAYVIVAMSRRHFEEIKSTLKRLGYKKIHWAL